MNPFERYGLNPLASVEELTERLRNLIEDADESERGRLRAAWEELSLHPERRFAHISSTFVDPSPPLEIPPGAPSWAASPGPAWHDQPQACTLDLFLGGGDCPEVSPYLPILHDPLMRDPSR